MQVYEKLYINGEWIQSSGNDVIEVVNPATEEIIGSIPVGSQGDVDAAVTAANVTTAADSVEIYNDYWFTLQPSQDANYYLADDVPLASADSFSMYTVPVHQRSDTYTLRVYSDSPFPVALTSAAWEGTYSPRYYRRT